MLRKTVLSLVLTPFLHAQEEEPSPAPTSPTKPNVEKISETHYKIGKITIDKKHREISFPAKFEQTTDDTLLEFLLTTPNGKIHETLLTADIVPFNLNLAIKLLGYKESRELFRILDEKNRFTDKYFEVDDATKAASRLTIHLTWTQDGNEKSVTVNEVIQVGEVEHTMDLSPWIYGGSYIHEGKFQPDLSGDIIAIFTDRASILNYSGKGREDDTIWKPFAKRLPPLGTPVTVTLKPYKAPVVEKQPK